MELPAGPVVHQAVQLVAQAARQAARQVVPLVQARQAQAQTLASRKHDVMKERANDALVDQEKARLLASNKELVAYTYRSKFASHQEAEEWGASTLLQFRSDYFGREPGALTDSTTQPPLTI